MRRRSFLASAIAAANLMPRPARSQEDRWAGAVEVLEQATATGQIESAVLHVVHRGEPYTRPFGRAGSQDAMFLLGSISKPINVAALMTLFDHGKFRLDDRVNRFLPEFSGDGRDDVTIQHLLTHVSGLPDQLPQNNELRRRHASLGDFVEKATKASLSFKPGSRYQYSSMGILLAARIGEIVSGTSMTRLVEDSVFQPLGMKHSAQGLGPFQIRDVVTCQSDGAAPESGAGDPTSRDWDWNSLYWRKLGAPWGGTHASAPDVGRFLMSFLQNPGTLLRPETSRLMTTNQNPAGLTARALGFGVGAESGSQTCSDQTFGHTGSTGTLCWADPATATICVVLTSFPGRGVKPHPRALAADRVAAAARR